MKPATLAAKNTVQQGHSVRVKPRLRSEWEYNRFSTPTVAVTPAQTGDDEWLAVFGDLDTLALPNRPRTGIAKARTGSTVRSLSIYRDTPNASRHYPYGPDDIYSYWGSVQKTKLVATNGSYQFDTPIQITVTYPVAVSANKVVVGYETSYAKPVTTTVEVSSDGVIWNAVATNPTINSAGLVELWSGNAGWGFTPDYDSPVIIKGVRLKVYSMNKALAHVDVLQIGARLENDLSDFVVSYDTQAEVTDRSFIAPVGRASSNRATVTLNNIDGRFNNHNPDSLYYGLIGKKIRFSLDIGIDTLPQGGAGYEYVREFTGWTDGWVGQERTNVEVELKDSSVLLQETDMPVVFFEESAAGAIIWQIMDRLGLSNYAYSRASLDLGQKIPYYWPESQTTAWEEISNIAEATQTAVYFDENDVMQIRARKAMYADKAVDWNLDALKNGLKLPDIIQTQTNYDLEANQVDIVYQPSSFSDFKNGLPKMETVWEPDEDTVVLRASAMSRDLTTTGTDLWIKQVEAVFWPYESIVNIRGEILRYSGKEYAYYNSSGVLKYSIIYSQEEKNSLDEQNSNLAWKNTFSGKMRVVERAMFGSSLSDHKVKPDAYTSVITSWWNTAFHPWTSGAQYMDGFMRQTVTVPGVDNHVYFLRKHESAVPPLPNTNSTVWYGARIRFPETGVATERSNWKIGGLWFAGDWGDAGYFLEITSTPQIDGWEQRRFRNEVCLVTMPSNASAWQAGRGEGGAEETRMGYAVTINEGQWYDLDVTYSKRTNGTAVISAYIDGIYVGYWAIPPQYQPPNNWKFGTHVRGWTTMDVEYLYAVTKDAADSRNPDSTNFVDLRRGGYSSGFIEKEVKYNFRYISPYKYPHYYPQRITNSTFVFDEYGPVVHEVRRFDVQFKEEARPVSNSYLYVSNSGKVETLYYESNAFEASFMLANAARENVIVKGEDTITFGSDNPINQSIFVYGRSVYQEEEKTLTKRDEDSIRKRGVSKTEFASRYIQTEEMANELGEWVIDLWAAGVDEVVVESFGNPFLQLGDVVTINYPVKGMYPSSHKYFVVAIGNSFSEGYTSTFTLRRARF